jgi:hypothetical protein
MATENLVNFLAKAYPQSKQLCVTYFNEVDTIDLLFWILLHVLSNQNEGVMMWYVFMAMKSSVQDFSPCLKQCECQPVFLFRCLIVLCGSVISPMDRQIEDLNWSLLCSRL